MVEAVADSTVEAVADFMAEEAQAVFTAAEVACARAVEAAHGVGDFRHPRQVSEVHVAQHPLPSAQVVSS